MGGIPGTDRINYVALLTYKAVIATVSSGCPVNLDSFLKSCRAVEIGTTPSEHPFWLSAAERRHTGLIVDFMGSGTVQ
jgi:hypothetical protein